MIIYIYIYIYHFHLCAILQYSCLENAMGGGAWQATYSSWGCKELNMTEPLHFIVHLHNFIFTAYTFWEFLKPLSDLALQRSMTSCPFTDKGEGNVLPTIIISYPYSIIHLKATEVASKSYSSLKLNILW